ncbi:hypothetical protein [Leminorella grimontii]|uniref:hypothetical protein n=1 Tax=Leminorella grimontii TaxID=82981 RepID=UPI00208BA24D|nr:hypothetical protein [Leminorella grimontii]GKX60224.1 hypothetical protein SOASR031_25390 [Leminorella grimontii]
MKKYIEENDIDYEKVVNCLKGSTYGDEDFALFKCPHCNKIYLIDYEVETIFPSANDLHLMANGTDFSCVKCGYSFIGKIIVGDRAYKIFKVTQDEIKDDDWEWVLK